MEQKIFQLGTHTEAEWDTLNHELINQGNLSAAVPSRPVICVDQQLHSATRGTYQLTQQEADELANDPRVKWINIDYKSYPEIYAPPPDELHATPVAAQPRWASNVKNYRVISGNTTAENEANRMGYGLLRHQQATEPWRAGALADTAVYSANVSQHATGKHVDLIVADDGGGWHGHPEFYNAPKSLSTGSAYATPRDYAGGNRLPGNGRCDMLDLALDAPYYLDPDWFNSSPATRLITRWDGTVVPVESEARAWWSNASNRSAAFAGAGTVTVPTAYTRNYNNGSNTVKATSGQHATPCCALSFGRTQGWAYNSNKWGLNLYGTNGVGIEPGFDLIKIFHQNKRVNPLYGNADPTVMSNSWGYRANKDPGGSTYYYTHRSSSNVSYTTETGIPWLSHMGLMGDGGRWKSEMKANSMLQALEELIQAGVIFVAAAGNSNQKVVQSSHPDYNNFITTSAGGNLAGSNFTEFGVNVFGTTNRRGFPQQGAAYIDGGGNRVYPVISIGALDDNFKSSLEAKVSYSDRGDAIDFYFAADGTLAANLSYATAYTRVDTYTGFGFTAEDTAFGGTSAACPGASGFIACLMEYNRTWTWQDIKAWIATLTPPSAANFYYGVESTTATTTNWEDWECLEGGTPFVAYQTPANYNENLAGAAAGFNFVPYRMNEGATGNLNIMTGLVNSGDTLYWTILHGSTSAADFVAESGSFVVTNDRGAFTVQTVADLTTEGTQSFQIQLRSGSISGTVLATSASIPVLDTSYFATASLSGFANTIPEGSSTTVTVSTTGVPDGGTLYWTINHGNSTPADFTATSGSFTVNSNTGSFVIFTNVT